MFTLKFISRFDNNYSQNVICCAHYHVYSRFVPDGDVGYYTYEITIYKDMTTVDGVSYRVSEHPLEVPHHQVCYVENVHGKTIERFGSLPKK